MADDPLRSTAREARIVQAKSRLAYWERRLNEFGAADRLHEIASALAETIDELRAEVERLEAQSSAMWGDRVLGEGKWIRHECPSVGGKWATHSAIYHGPAEAEVERLRAENERLTATERAYNALITMIAIDGNEDVAGSMP